MTYEEIRQVGSAVSCGDEKRRLGSADRASPDRIATGFEHGRQYPRITVTDRVMHAPRGISAHTQQQLEPRAIARLDRFGYGRRRQ